MLSRSRIFIEKDYKKLKECKLWGIEAKPVNSDDLYNWHASIRGNIDTSWEGGVFKLYMKFDEYYNDQPPRVFFLTIPFHPNVDVTTGQVALDFLCDKDKWKPSYDLVRILLSIQAMLSSPRMDFVVNQEAKDLYIKNPRHYEEISRQCADTSRQFGDFGTLNDLLPNSESKFSTSNRTKPVLIHLNASSQGPLTVVTENVQKTALKKITFEDYYELWSKIGTSNSHLKPINNTGISGGAKANKKSNTTQRTSAAASVATERGSGRIVTVERGVTSGGMIGDGTDVVDEDEPSEIDVDELITWIDHLDAGDI